MSNYSKLFLRKTKTDKKDAFAIASFLLNYHKPLYKKLRSQPLQQLKKLTKEKNITSQIAKLENNIEKLLAITFPKLPQHINPSSKSIFNLLCSSHTIKNSPIKTINPFLNLTKGRNLLSLLKRLSPWPKTLSPPKIKQKNLSSLKKSLLSSFSLKN
ncbi:MAG: transposase [Candidatus Desulfofervidaceae bacterium]|nr:transposase [Candidatus Desulfofervidaceae bacterium]